MSAESEETGDEQTINNKREFCPAVKHFGECANVSKTKSKMAAEMRFAWGAQFTEFLTETYNHLT